jgi:hypothetical protein
MDTPAAATPIVCDMTGAPDTGPERIAEYQRLFAQALIGRDRTPQGIRFRFRAEDGIEPWVRDLAAKEKACCAFFTFTVTRAGEEVLWDATVVDDEVARAILEAFYALPDTLGQGADALQDRFIRQGLRFVPDPAG